MYSYTANCLQYTCFRYRSFDVKYLPNLNSQGRLMTLKAIIKEQGKPENLKDMLSILSYEATDDMTPLFRSGLYPDQHSTLVTGKIYNGFVHSQHNQNLAQKLLLKLRGVARATYS